MKIYFLLSISFCLVFLSCTNNSNDVEIPFKPLTESEKSVVSGISDFAFTLFKKVNSANIDKNVFISPFSVSLALSMTWNGANGKTFEDMRTTLGFQSLSVLEVNQAFKNIFPTLCSLDKNVEFKIANSVWCRKGIIFEPDFLDALVNYYNAYAETLDFSSPNAKEVINKWVEENTKGKIQEIIKSIPNYAVMYIINALYFKGKWKYQFDKSKTTDGDFLVNEEHYVRTKFMVQSGKYECFFDKEFNAIRLPYGKGDYAMVVLLPNTDIPIDDFISNLDRNKWENCVNNLKETEEVTLYIPRFKSEFEVNLNQILKSMGMEIAFSDFADFSKLCKTVPCQITDVVHKTYIEVNEEGTEAA
ncbi:MAG: serpin family protein, partial [Candidatus Kapaibacteriota bacterium]